MFLVWIYDAGWVADENCCVCWKQPINDEEREMDDEWVRVLHVNADLPQWNCWLPAEWPTDPLLGMLQTVWQPAGAMLCAWWLWPGVERGACVPVCDEVFRVLMMHEPDVCVWLGCVKWWWCWCWWLKGWTDVCAPEWQLLADQCCAKVWCANEHWLGCVCGGWDGMMQCCGVLNDEEPMMLKCWMMCVVLASCVCTQTCVSRQVECVYVVPNSVRSVEE